MRLPSQMHSGPRITSGRITTGVMPSAHELKRVSTTDWFRAGGRPQLCAQGERLCLGNIDVKSQTIPYICCPQRWQCAFRNGLPDCKLPFATDYWFKQKLGRDVFGEIMRRVNVPAR
jgi:hypothetical protein